MSSERIRSRRPTQRSARRLGKQFEELVRLLQRLLGPQGCPWDRKQTHRSLRPYVLEEAYEVVDAIERGDPRALADELGDLLLQVLFHAQLAAKQGRFDLGDVLAGLQTKLIRRHPHVFGPKRLATAAQVERSWQALKASEDSPVRFGKTSSLLDAVPGYLTALQEADRLGRAAARVGFDWPEPAALLEKIGEETAELRRLPPFNGARRLHRRHLEEELGDLLFTVANLARHLGADPEVTLRRANRKFRQRFRQMERLALREGKRLAQLSPQEWERLWQQVKANSRRA